MALARMKMTEIQSGPDCGVEDESAPVEQSVSTTVAQAKIFPASPCIEETNSCDKHDSAIEEISCLVEQPGILTRQPQKTCTSCGRDDQSSLLQKCEKPQGGDKGQPSSVENCIVQETEEVSTCRGDGKDFTASSVVIQHQATDNEEELISDTVPEKDLHTKPNHQCSECGKIFSYKNRLVEHQRVHTNEKPYMCEICGKLFRYRGDLSTHQKGHTGTRPYECAKCGKSFSRSHFLHRHQITHTKERPYKCDECGETFCRRDVLLRHLKANSAEEPYVCSTCGKNFTHKNVFVKHERGHTEQKCKRTECAKELSTQLNVPLHKRNHSGGKHHVCSECGKSYVSRSHFNQHKKAHVTVRPADDVNEENSTAAAPATVNH